MFAAWTSVSGHGYVVDDHDEHIFHHSYYPKQRVTHIHYHFASPRHLEELANNKPAQENYGGIPPAYGYNVGSPFFGGANAHAAASLKNKEVAQASSLDKAKSGASAEKKADRGDIFYEKLIIFKKSHDRVKEQAQEDKKMLSKKDAGQVADHVQSAEQGQSIG